MKKNLFFLLFTQGCNYVVPLLLVPYLVRILGPSGYGDFNFALSIVLYASIFIDFGFNLYSSSIASKINGNAESINEIFSVTLYSRLAICIIAIAAVFCLSFFSSRVHEIKILLVFFLFQLFGSAIGTLWWYQGVEKIWIYSCTMAATKLLNLPLVFLFVNAGTDITVLVLIQSVVFFLASLFLFFFALLRGRVRLTGVPFNNTFKHFKGAGLIFMGGITVSLYTMSTPLVLGFMSSSYDVGVYSAADKIRGVFISCFLILSNVIYPMANRLYAESEEKALRLIKKIIIAQIICSFFLSVLLFFLSKIVVYFYLGPSFDGAISLLKLLSLTIIFVPLSVIISNYIFLVFGYRKYYLLVPAISTICHFIYLFPLVNFYGYLGAGVSVALTEAISFSVLLYLLIKSGLAKRILYA